MMSYVNRLALLSAGSLCLFACNGTNYNPYEAKVYDQVELQASAVELVNNDELEAQLFIEKTAADPKSLSKQINPMIATALEKAKDYPDVKLSTANQRSTPNYNYKTNKITSWSMRSELRLVSTNFEAAGDLIGILQDSGIQVADINFRVSDAQRQKVENQMINQVTDSFKQRAEVAKDSWGAKDFRLVKLAIKSNTNIQDTPYYGDAAFTGGAVAMEASAAEPAPIAAGEQRIEMVAQGAVELIN